MSGWCIGDDGNEIRDGAVDRVPMAPEELSTFSSAGETRSRNSTAPSAASSGSRRATFLISATLYLTRAIAGCDFQPKTSRRKRLLKSHLRASAFTLPSSPVSARRARVCTLDLDSSTLDSRFYLALIRNPIAGILES